MGLGAVWIRLPPAGPSAIASSRHIPMCQFPEGCLAGFRPLHRWFCFLIYAVFIHKVWEGDGDAAESVADEGGADRRQLRCRWRGSRLRPWPELGGRRECRRPDARGGDWRPAWLRPGRSAEPSTFAAGLPGTAADRQRAHLPRGPQGQMATLELRQRPPPHPALPPGVRLHARANSVAGHPHRHAHLCPVPLPREQAMPRPPVREVFGLRPLIVINVKLLILARHGNGDFFVTVRCIHKWLQRTGCGTIPQNSYVVLYTGLSSLYHLGNRRGPGRYNYHYDDGPAS